jgi:DhnA family fructose-bisphosphate aldolase class Ia
MSDPTPNVTNLRHILEKVVVGRPDGILVSYGTARRMCDLFTGKGRPALIIRADWMNMPRLDQPGGVLPVSEFKKKATSCAIDALHVGASAITIYYFVGYSAEFEALNIEQDAIFAQECRRIGLPVIIEPMVVGRQIPAAQTAEALIAAARIAVDLGADALKIPYTGDVISFRKLVETAGVPVLVLGGAKFDDPADALHLVEEALQAGARGTVFGRNVTMAADPRRMVEDIGTLVHGGKSVAEIMTSGKGR